MDITWYAKQDHDKSSYLGCSNGACWPGGRILHCNLGLHVRQLLLQGQLEVVLGLLHHLEGVHLCRHNSALDGVRQARLCDRGVGVHCFVVCESIARIIIDQIRAALVLADGMQDTPWLVRQVREPSSLSTDASHAARLADRHVPESQALA